MAVLLCLLCILPFLRTSLWVVLLSALLVLPLTVRRRFPVTSAAVVLGTAFVQWITVRGPNIQILPADVAVLVAVYSVTAYGPRWAKPVALVTGLLGATLAGQLWPIPPSESARTADHVFVGVADGIAVVAVWAIGRLRGVRLEQVEALRERARLLEVERDQRARLAVQVERARIAREMHDVVAHSLAVMIAQADGGRYAATGSPQAQAVLTTIGETGRQALSEMRRLLAVLREDARPGEAGLGPQPGISDVPLLVARVRDGGLRVTLTQEGDDVLEPGMGLVVYRIVQEGLTNVIKHAGPAATARVLLRRAGPTLEVSVVDDGRGAGATAPGGGHGLVGMRERAAAYGGTVEAGPVAGGGFAVRARLPLAAA